MSGPTKADLIVQVQELHSKAEVAESRRRDLSIQRDKLIKEAQDERRRVDHYRALRDQLVGYIEGSRTQEPIDVDPDIARYYQPGPTKILPLDVFLDRMRGDT